MNVLTHDQCNTRPYCPKIILAFGTPSPRLTDPSIPVSNTRTTIPPRIAGFTEMLAISRLMATLLFGVNATDPFTFIAVATILGVVALVACYIPARRATKIDPLEALRAD